MVKENVRVRRLSLVWGLRQRTPWCPSSRTRTGRTRRVAEEEFVRGALLPVSRAGARGTPQALWFFRYIPVLFLLRILRFMDSGWVSGRALRPVLLVQVRGAEVGLRRCLCRRRLQLRIVPWSRRDRPSRRSWRRILGGSLMRWIRWVLLPFLENAIFLRCILHDLRVLSSRTKLLERRMDCLTRVQAMVPVGGRPPRGTDVMPVGSRPP